MEKLKQCVDARSSPSVADDADLSRFMKYVESHDPELEVEFWHMNGDEQIAFQKATAWRKYPVNDKSTSFSCICFSLTHRLIRMEGHRAHGYRDSTKASR